MLCYNQARYVIECLEAVKAQNYPNLELIINDDASQDDSVAVIESWLARNKVPHQFFKSQTNQGICHSLNKTLNSATGKYVTGIAADDVWLPGKILTQVEIMEKLPAKVGVIYGEALQMDETGKPLSLTFTQADGRTRHLEAMPTGNIQVALWRDNFIAPMTTLIRRECFERVGTYDESLFAEDWDMWLRISRCYDFFWHSEITARYRIVGNSATRGNFGRLLDDMCQVCVKHLASGELEPEAKRAAAVKLHELASSSFERKSVNHKRNLRASLKFKPTAGVFARLFLTQLGLGGGAFEKMRGVIRGQRTHTSVWLY